MTRSTTALHEAGHALIGRITRGQWPVLVSVSPAHGVSGFCDFGPPPEGEGIAHDALLVAEYLAGGLAAKLLDALSDAPAAVELAVSLARLSPADADIAQDRPDDPPPSDSTDQDKVDALVAKYPAGDVMLTMTTARTSHQIIENAAIVRTLAVALLRHSVLDRAAIEALLSHMEVTP